MIEQVISLMDPTVHARIVELDAQGLDPRKPKRAEVEREDPRVAAAYGWHNIAGRWLHASWPSFWATVRIDAANPATVERRLSHIFWALMTGGRVALLRREH